MDPDVMIVVTLHAAHVVSDFLKLAKSFPRFACGLVAQFRI